MLFLRVTLHGAFSNVKSAKVRALGPGLLFLRCRRRWLMSLMIALMMNWLGLPHRAEWSRRGVTNCSGLRKKETQSTRSFLGRVEKQRKRSSSRDHLPRRLSSSTERNGERRRINCYRCVFTTNAAALSVAFHPRPSSPCSPSDGPPAPVCPRDSLTGTAAVSQVQRSSS